MNKRQERAILSYIAFWGFLVFAVVSEYIVTFLLAMVGTGYFAVDFLKNSKEK